MKKILFLLLCTVSIYGQVSTGQEQEFDYGIKNNASQTVTIPTNIVTQGTDGTQGIISPNYLIDVIEVSSATTLPVTGVVAKIYCTLDNNKIYRWNGTVYQELAVTDISSKENIANKQNSLVVDGTGVKFPTVDAVNSIGLQKVIDVDGYAESPSGNSYVGIFDLGGDSIGFSSGNGISISGLDMNEDSIRMTSNSSNGNSSQIDLFGKEVTLRSSSGLNTSVVGFENPIASGTGSFLNFPAKPTGTYTLATLDDIPSPVDISGKANIDSPTFTGIPAAPTAAAGTNTTQLATTAFVTNQSGLIPINEGNGIGYRLATSLATNYGNIGSDAVDLSASDTQYSSFGATGATSFAMGQDIIASNWSSVAFGYKIDNGGIGSFDAGFNLKDRGYTNSLFGIGHDVTSMNTTVVGQASNIISSSIINFNTDAKPLFVVGNGTIAQNDVNYSVLTRSDALIARLNGSVEAPSLTTSLINADTTGKILVTKEYLSSVSTGGTVTSVTGTNGVTVATGTTAPVIGLGDITPTSTNGVSAATMAYMDATASVQTQLNGKQATLTNPVTGTGTSGQVSFWNGTNTQTGDNNLFWDNTNKRLGIGTTNPGYKLEVAGGGDPTALRVTGTGTGIQWTGRVIVGGTNNVFLMGEYNTMAWLGAHNADLNAWAPIYINPDGTQKLYLGANGAFSNGPAMTVNNADGYVGIGTTGPTAKLVINSGELLVNTNVNNGVDAIQTPGSILANGIKSTGIIRLNGYTVATLPAGVQGDNAFVTDALAPSFMVTIVGGGAVVTKVFYNGTNWIAD